MKVCWDCRFFKVESESSRSEPWNESEPGECRRYPPEVGDMVNDERWFGDFPRVMACEWCGEFEERVD